MNEILFLALTNFPELYFGVSAPLGAKFLPKGFFIPLARGCQLDTDQAIALVDFLTICGGWFINLISLYAVLLVVPPSTLFEKTVAVSALLICITFLGVLINKGPHGLARSVTAIRLVVRTVPLGLFVTKLAVLS